MIVLLKQIFNPVIIITTITMAFFILSVTRSQSKTKKR